MSSTVVNKAYPIRFDPLLSWLTIAKAIKRKPRNNIPLRNIR